MSIAASSLSCLVCGRPRERGDWCRDCFAAKLSACWFLRLCGLARKLLRSGVRHLDSEDVANDSLFVCTRALDGGRMPWGASYANLDTFGPFLCCTVRNICRNCNTRSLRWEAVLRTLWFPKGAKRRRSEGQWDVTVEMLDRGLDDEEISSIRADVVREALDELTEVSRAVIVLMDFAELKEDDIATGLGIKPGTVKSKRNRAKRALIDLTTQAAVSRLSEPMRTVYRTIEAGGGPPEAAEAAGLDERRALGLYRRAREFLEDLAVLPPQKRDEES